MNFKDLYETDVTKHIEKKGKFNYLSWVYAVKVFRQSFPKGTWDIKHFGENGQPYCQTAAGAFVEVTVFPEPENAVGFTQVHPVLDHRNKTIAKPNAFDINTSIQRCLAKAIALTGLGLHIYAGEDTAQYDEPSEKGTTRQKTTIKAYINTMQSNSTPESVDEWMAGAKEDIALDLNDKEKGILRTACRDHIAKLEGDAINAKQEDPDDPPF